MFADFTLEICSTGVGDISSGIGSSGARPTRARGGLGAARTRGCTAAAPLALYGLRVYAVGVTLR